MRSVYGACLFIGAFLLAVGVTRRSWDGVVFVYLGEQRAPASVRKLEDYTAVDARALSASVSAQVLNEAKSTAASGSIGITLGHPLVPIADGAARDFACAIPGHAGLYDRVHVTLYGTGVTDSGEEPHLEVDTACHARAASSRLDTIWIPMAQIAAQPTGDGTTSLGDADQTTITLSHIPSTWPGSWTVVSVRFYRADSVDVALNLSAEQLQADGFSLLSFDWQGTGVVH